MLNIYLITSIFTGFVDEPFLNSLKRFCVLGGGIQALRLMDSRKEKRITLATSSKEFLKYPCFALVSKGLHNILSSLLPDFLGLPLALVISGECFPVLPSDMTDYLFFKALHEFLSYNSALGRVDLALQFQAVWIFWSSSATWLMEYHDISNIQFFKLYNLKPLEMRAFYSLNSRENVLECCEFQHEGKTCREFIKQDLFKKRFIYWLKWNFNISVVSTALTYLTTRTFSLKEFLKFFLRFTFFHWFAVTGGSILPCVTGYLKDYIYNGKPLPVYFVKIIHLAFIIFIESFIMRFLISRQFYKNATIICLWRCISIFKNYFFNIKILERDMTKKKSISN